MAAQPALKRQVAREGLAMVVGMVPAAMAEMRERLGATLRTHRQVLEARAEEALVRLAARAVPLVLLTHLVAPVAATEEGKGVTRGVQAHRPGEVVVADMPEVAAADGPTAVAAVPIWYRPEEAWLMGMEARALS